MRSRENSAGGEGEMGKEMEHRAEKDGETERRGE
jgi:hypothetical protein